MTTAELRTAETIKQFERCWFARNGVVTTGFAVARTPSYTCVTHDVDTLTAVRNEELYASEDEAKAAAEQQKITYKVFVKTDW